MTGPREEDGDYAREFFDGYEREADRIATVPISSATWAALKQGEAERAGYSLTNLYDADLRTTDPTARRLASELPIPHPLRGVQYADGIG